MSKFNVGDHVKLLTDSPYLRNHLDARPGSRATVVGPHTSAYPGGPITLTMVRFDHNGSEVNCGFDELEHVKVRGLASEEELLGIQERLTDQDEVNPTHYSGDLVMRVIEERGLDFALGNAVKYVCRAGSKGDKLTDLKKALWYLERAIAKEEEH